MNKSSFAIEAAWYRQFWPWFLITLPSIAVCASFISLGIAVRYSDSNVRDTYSKQGFAILPTNAADTEAAQRQLGAALIITSAGRIDLNLHGQLARDQTADNQIATAPLHLAFIHPLDNHRDTDIALALDADGHYRGQLPHILAGRWLIELQQPGQHWRLRRNIEFAAQQDLHATL